MLASSPEDPRRKPNKGTILGIRDNDKWFSTTLASGPDVSGGPLLNSENEVIGIEVIEGAFGYAVPSNILQTVLLAQTDTVESFKEWQQRDAIRAYSYVAQAKRKFRDDDYRAMIAALNAAITLNPEFATAYTKRSEAKLYLGEFESEKGHVTEVQGYYRSAIDDSDKALQLNPESAAAYKNRGLAKRLLADSETDTEQVSAQNDYHAAIDDYTQAIEWMPNHVESYTDRGTARKNLGQFESEAGNAAAQRHYHAAIDDYTHAIKLKPDYAKAYHGRGLTKELLGQQEEAKADFEKAETLKREQATVRVGGRDSDATGFFVTRNKVATNIHVIAHLESVYMQSVDREKIWTVEGVTAFDVNNDLVLLKVAEEGAPLPLGNSNTLQKGETVSAVGYPKGKYTVSEGTLHSIRDSDKWLQMNVKISPGNSGSPVINSKGQVIGIVSGVVEPYSYAIPSNALEALIVQSGSAEPLALWRNQGSILVYVHSSQGARNYGEGHYDKAIADFNKVIEVNPENIYAYYNRGLAKFRLGDLESEKGNTEKARKLYREGIEDSTQAIKQDPEDANAYHNRAGGKFRLAQSEKDTAKAQQYYQDAIDDCTQVLQLNPKLVDSYISRSAAETLLGESKADHGDIAAAQELYRTAIRDCTQAIRLTPENAVAYSNRGYAKFRLGRTKSDQGDIAGAEILYIASVQDSTHAIQLNPENAEAYGNRGTAKAALSNAEGAIADFDAAIRLDPENANYFYERGQAKEVLGQKESAKADFEKAKELDPNIEQQ